MRVQVRDNELSLGSLRSCGDSSGGANEESYELGHCHESKVGHIYGATLHGNNFWQSNGQQRVPLIENLIKIINEARVVK